MAVAGSGSAAVAPRVHRARSARRRERTLDSLPAFEITGPADAPVVLVLGGISANHHVCRTPANPTHGWWDPIAGPGRALDTARWRVLGVDFVDGGRGPDGLPAHTVTTRDQAVRIAAVLDRVALPRVHAIVGASYGGMVALAFAERYPDRVGQLVVIGAAHRAHPMATARRIIQRQVVELGVRTGRAREALAIARALALTTYRSDLELARRFGDDPAALQSWLAHNGDKFARRFPPERFLALSLSADLHAVDPRRVRVPSLLVAAENDTLVPRDDVEQLARTLGAPCRVAELPGEHGHDAFLIDYEPLTRILRPALDAAEDRS